MIDLSTSEIEMAKEILNKGINKSSDSLSFFTKSKVSIDTFDIYLEPDKDKGFNSVTEHNVTVLSTKLMGDLSGECYLVFNDNDKEELLNTCLSKSILDNPSAKKEMGEALLLEIDNIVSASAITEFSNILEKTVYGDVPYLISFSSVDLPGFISDRSLESYSFRLKVEMVTENGKISPQFIWTIGKDFILSLKKNAAEGSDKL